MQEVNPFVDGNEDISSLSHKTATICIKSLSQTRWTACADAAKVVIDKQQPLIETLEAIKVDSSLLWDVKADARGLFECIVVSNIAFTCMHFSFVSCVGKTF